MPKTASEDPLEYVILGILSHEPMAGYDIKKYIDNQIAYFWPEESYGRIYPILKRLAKEKSVTITEVKQSKRPTKKIYTTTAKGNDKLVAWLKEPLPLQETNHSFTILQEFLVKIYFGGKVSKEQTMELIKQLEEWLAKVIPTFKLFEQSLEDSLTNNKGSNHPIEDHIYFLLTVLLGKKIFQGTKEWIKEAKKRMEKV
jgi:DNA-binding PadR family transcriptional regulator